MTELDDLTDRDHKLLDEIEAIVDHSHPRGLEDEPIVGFSSLLASTLPQASPSFQHKLWTDMVSNKAAKKRFPGWISSPFLQSGQRVMPVPHLRRSALAILVISLAVIFIAAAFIPPVRAFAGEILKHITLSQYSRISQVEPITPGAKLAITPTWNMWSISTGLENYGGNLPDGVNSTVRIFNALEDAQAQVSYQIKQPNYLPEGYRLHELKVPPAFPGSPETVFLFYAGPGKDIYLSSSPAGTGPVITNSSKSISLDVQEVTVSQHVVVQQMVTDGTLEEAKVNNQTAAWVDGHLLVWYVDGFVYHVGGLDLTEPEAIKIAESIK